MIRVLVTACLLALPLSLAGQAPDSSLAPEEFGLTCLTDYLGLKPDDISYRSDYTEPDSFRLEIVARLMRAPLDMIDYAASLKGAHVKAQPEIIAGVLFQDLRGEYQTRRSRPYTADISEIQRLYNIYYNDISLNQLLTRAAVYIDIIFPRSLDKSLALLSAGQRVFLKKQFKELIVIGEDEEYLSVEAIDSLEKVEEGYCEEFITFGTRIDKDPIVAAGIDCLRELMAEIKNIRRLLASGQISPAQVLEGVGYLPDDADQNSYLGRQAGWRIGGTGNDYYTGEFKFIFDFGGDDVYDLSADPEHPHGTIIIDLSGDDSYRGQSDFVFGSGFFSVGLLLDFEGNDRYDGGSFSLGSGYFGMGLLYDAEGDDRYDGDTHVQGAGSFGLGLLIDEAGRDIYNAAVYSQGFGFVQGAGAIYDGAGSDSYYAGGKYKDILRYEDHYLSLSQGFGYGLRPWMSGGIGAIVDVDGNDSYYSDIFAQAASYWWSLMTRRVTTTTSASSTARAPRLT